MKIFKIFTFLKESSVLVTIKTKLLKLIDKNKDKVKNKLEEYIANKSPKIKDNFITYIKNCQEYLVEQTKSINHFYLILMPSLFLLKNLLYL